ncbi:MAG TPA: MerR family DNA-binding transcriptional regulator [Sedimenticola thiotaurini]|uniref:MerR family DNA-binding transcriptional regulator n=1 Tax=Sedimenticola thiotaurini TaxID=1543721 RepID=A0A831RLP5_9GAMM|nr:MerR family DNA-binding transcriptional regulator [Sedimenticola thiotaurini]
MKGKTYSISDLSKEFDITPRSIRFYEDQGLLSPVRKGRQRVFRDRDYVRLKLILRGKRLGFTLAEIKEIIELYDMESGGEKQLVYFLDKIRQRRASLEQQMQDIEDTLQDMKSVERRVKKALKEIRGR